MSRAVSKNQRWLKLEQLLSRNPEGIKISRLAEELRVHRATVYRDIEDLTFSGVPIWHEDGLVGLLIEKHLSHLRLNIYEALSLFIAARLLCRQSGEYDPHMVSLLEKLADMLPFPVSDHLIRSANILKTRSKDDLYVQNLETLMLAWVNRKRVRMWYRSAWKSYVKERLFDIYFIEPLEQVFSYYVIGLDHSYGEIRTFKVKRIQKLEILDESYDIRSGFDLFKRWANSWGIVMSPASEPIRVKLRFSPNLAFMIKEAVWHHSQQIEDTDDGGCIFYATVDHIMGIKIWIRTWGPDVTVLEPEALRREVAYEARLLSDRYKDVDTSDITAYSGKYAL